VGIIVREKKNKIRKVGVQIFDKSGGSYRKSKTTGSFSDPEEIT
jgi:hypothetical protein